MDVFLTRLLLFTFTPLAFAGAQILLDKSTDSRDRRLEVVLIYLFALGVAGSGIGGFIAHFFLADVVAESIGWAAGSPFQLEIAFANLAIGLLGILSVNRRDGAREATVLAATVFSVGATVVHIMDIIGTGNLAPGNTIQNASNLLRPLLLIWFLAASRRAAQVPDSEAGTVRFELWRAPRAQAAGYVTAIASTGFGLGFALGRPFIGSLLGALIAALVVYLVLRRAPEMTQESLG